ncbi:hypothetical protein RB595_004873 [Gaeumannomyces hyphopodioides]
MTANAVLPTPAAGAADKAAYPPVVDLRTMMAKRPLPAVAPGTVDASSLTGKEPARLARGVLDKLNASLTAGDAAGVKDCFNASQAYWKDSIALTWHLRTFATPSTIAASLLETSRLRGLSRDGFQVDGDAQFNPVFSFIDCPISFATSSPATKAIGKVLLLPVRGDKNQVEWKIWILATRLESLDVHPENEALLRQPGRTIDGKQDFETQVLILGAGNAAAILAARLKALGVESVMVERYPRVGDNWARRYDCLQFHVPTSSAQTPYLPYDDSLLGRMLKREDLTNHMRRYVAEFHLNVLTSSRVQSSVFDTSAKKWTVTIQTTAGRVTATARHVVQATGLGSQQPFIPKLADEGLYKGVSIHSTEYQNPEASLKAKGVRSVLVVGSANTAFDVLQDVHDAGLETTIVARSRTFVVPVEYLRNPRALGSYDAGVEEADRNAFSLPTWVEAWLVKELFASLARAEPDRYRALAATGFPVLDSADKDACLLHNILERGGGHYVDMGTTRLIADGKVGVKAGVAPVAYTEHGLRFSDGSTIEADAVVWCTGFRDKDVRQVLLDVLGSEPEQGGPGRLGPRDVLARMDATWGVDAEGEVRGVWKRHLGLERDGGVNYWVTGGHTQFHRYHSTTIVLQIKAELEGLLPEAYRKTPGGH